MESSKYIALNYDHQVPCVIHKRRFKAEHYRACDKDNGCRVHEDCLRRYKKFRSFIVKTLYCYYCGKEAETWDHIIPRALGGISQRWNLVPACQSCNCAKKSDTYEKFTGTETLPKQCIVAGVSTTENWIEFLKAFSQKDE